MPSPRSILITGCSSGIGLASARVMKARGWRVLATARSEYDLDHLRHVEQLETIPLELADPESVANCAAQALDMTSGELFALFNNAAYGRVSAVEDLPVGLLRHQFEVNLFGTHELTRLVLPAMRRRGAGRIVQCSSVLGLLAAPYRGAYCASKFALEALTDAMRLELAGTGVRVSLIEPGPIRTRFVARALELFKTDIDRERSPHRQIYEQRLAAMEAGGKQTFKLEPEAVAAKLVHAVESNHPKRRYYVTTPTYAAAIFKRLLPGALLDQVAVRS